MQRFAIFVDGSNLFGCLKHLNVRVDDYGEFFKNIFDKAVHDWQVNCHERSPLSITRLRRVYWYVVGELDQWDLDVPKTEKHLKERFTKSQDLKKRYMAAAGQGMNGAKQADVLKQAWVACLDDFKEWYGRKKDALDGMHRFYHAVRMSTDFIDIRETGRWKVDFDHLTVREKGIDTSLAVDMLRLADNYDVAIVMSGDADSIPSINHVKNHGKEVCVVEFHKGYPPEKKGKSFSGRLKYAADFVLHVYEMDLVRAKIARRGSDETASNATDDGT